ncbi:MBL fold metallo-hydrolase [Pseudochelatococcus sp. B33]
MTGTSCSRRGLMSGAALLTAGLAVPQILTRAAFAQFPAPQSERPADAPGFRRFRLGEFDVVTLLDGKRVSPGPHPTFGADQPPETVATLLRENFLPETSFVNGFAPVLVDTGTERILFDTGFGADGRANGLGQLEANLAAAGYAPDQVSIVVITHFHGDHISGLINGGTPAFPNARYVFGQAEYDFWTSPERIGTPTENAARTVEAKVKPLADKATFIAAGDTVVSGITSEAAFGHTPGHLIFHVESAGKHLVLTADTANHYVASLQRPDWEVGFDYDKRQAAETRRRVFDRIATDRLPFIGYHMPFPSIGYVEKLDQGFRFVPATYQFDV